MEFTLAWELPVEKAEKLQKLLMPVPRLALADNLAVQHTQGREQGRRAVALVVMRHGAAAALFHRQSRLSPIERLNLTLFINAQHEHFLGRVQSVASASDLQGNYPKT